MERVLRSTSAKDPPRNIKGGALGRRSLGCIRRPLGSAGHWAAGSRAAAIYLLHMAFRKRTLFKMDFAEALYIAELRSAPAGHFSYRNVAYAMYEEIARTHPSLARSFRVSDVHEPVDLLKR